MGSQNTGGVGGGGGVEWNLIAEVKNFHHSGLGSVGHRKMPPTREGREP